MMSRSDSRNFSKFYFTVVSIGSILGMVIAGGIALYTIAMSVIITDEEYIQWHNSREVEQCSDPYHMPKSRVIVEQDIAEAEAGWQEIITKTPEEIAECEADARARVILQRNYQKKEAVAGGLIRGVLFALLFIFHYPRMHAVEEAPVVEKKTTRRVAKKRAPAKKKTAVKKK